MAKAQILIVEDDNIVVLELSDRLQSLGYAVSGVASYGKEAVEKAAEMRPDLALMDIRLKGAMNGVGAAEEIRARFDIPVVYLTAYADEDTLQRAKVTEPYGYIIKPFQERELYSTIEMALYKHKAEVALRDSEERFRDLYENAPNAYFSVGADGIINKCNRRGGELLGYAVEELVGRPMFELYADTPQGKEKASKVFHRFRAGETISDEELQMQKADGTLVWISLTMNTIRDDRGQVVESRSMVVDITKRKWAEEELQHTLEKLRKALGSIIQTVALTVEAKDPYIAGHQRRVANLARTIATEMGLSENQIDGVRMAAAIHDIGKIGIPSEILGNPVRLKDYQWDMIKTHPQAGYDILKSVEFPWPVAQIVLQHHERMDGSGYPQGLSGDEIMLEARILAVADVVEAIDSFRPYRPALGIDKALEELSQNRGVLYDPEAVDACLKLFIEKGFKFE